MTHHPTQSRGAQFSDEGSSRTPRSERIRQLVGRPQWLARFERALAGRIGFHPNTLSAGKLLIITPALLLSLRQVDALPGGPALAVLLFAAFAALDYLDGVVARERSLATSFGRVFDRVTDYPLLIGLSYFCLDVIPLPLLATKIGVDLLLLVLFALGYGSTQNRLRTAISYTTLLGLLTLSQGWLPIAVGAPAVTGLLAANVALSVVVALYNLRVLRKRFVADMLSAGNLCCGLLAIAAAAAGRFELSLALLALGLLFDGFDGAAARRWGSTRWGVYADDVADAVNFGIAPGFVVYFALGGITGAVIGALYAIFTVARLVYFTMNKGVADPNYFGGVPSPVGGLIVTCSVILLREQPALVGLMVGVAISLMISFATRYRHLGRAIAKHRRVLLAAPAVAVTMLAAGWIWGPHAVIAIVLLGAVGYGLLPMARSFARAADTSPAA